MVRPTARTATLTLLCVLAGACESVLGNVDVSPASGREQMTGQLGSEPALPPSGSRDYPPLVDPIFDAPYVPPSMQDAGDEQAADAGVDGSLPESPDAGADAAPAAPPPDLTPRPVLVDGPVTLLERVGVDGGGPRLGICEQGIVIGVRPTANPGEDVFGQRLTFVEPICGAAQADASGVVQVTRDDARLRWETSGDFEGEPTTEVPDERLIWVQQPETSCPASAPVLVGLSGEYDPVAPDSTDTAAIRSLVIECAPLVIADNGVDVSAGADGHQLISRADSFSASGTDSYRSACEAGAVMTQLQLHAGFWLDGFVLGCSSLRSPRAVGAPCSTDRECSGVCASDGTCAP